MPAIQDRQAERENRWKFIGSLLYLAQPDDEGKKDRAALAALRGSLRGTPIDQYRAAKYVVDFLGEDESWNDQWFFLVAGLLALHPQHEPGLSPGKAFHKLRDDSGSMDSRVLAVLNTRALALPRVLRQMIDLLKARGIGIDYGQLLDDLCLWNLPGNNVQKRWARHYFRDAKPSASENASNGGNDTEKETSHED